MDIFTIAQMGKPGLDCFAERAAAFFEGMVDNGSSIIDDKAGDSRRFAVMVDPLADLRNHARALPHLSVIILNDHQKGINAGLAKSAGKAAPE